MDEVVVDTEVIVVGAGPAGLMLANELGLAGISTVVIEARHGEIGQSRAGGTQPRTGEVLDLRGLLEPLVAEGAVVGLGAGHFAGLPLGWRRTDTRQPWRHVPQHLLEEFLAKRLTDYGIPVLRGHRLVALEQDAERVTATVETEDGPLHRTATCLVGADGGHSTVRRLVGLDFPGRPATTSLLLADVRLDGPVESVLPVGARGVLDFTRQLGGDRWMTLLPYLGDVYRLKAGPGDLADRDRPVSEEEVAEVLFAAYGSEIRLRELCATTRFGNAYRQVSRYIANRVCVVGDAAHIHPPMGGQGLNLGVQDAVNLGWKLAAAVRGWAPPGLLNSYQAERHPVGARVLRNVKAQTALAGRAGGEDVAALREVIGDLLEIHDAHEAMTAMMAGTDIRYDLPGEHPLVGRRLPDLDAVDVIATDRAIRLPELLRTGRGQLVDFGDIPELRTAVLGWSDRVDHQRVTISADAFEPQVAALLVRPDGYVCLVGTSGTDRDVKALRSTLEIWFGKAKTS